MELSSQTDYNVTQAFASGQWGSQATEATGFYRSRELAQETEPAPLLDNYVISARSRKPKLEENRRIRRFYQRYFTGIGIGGKLRILCLTSSDEALASDLDIHRSFRALVMRLRRRYGHFEYIGVREIKGERQHLHLVFRGEYMQQAMISAMWSSIYKSPVVDIRAIYKVRGGARYLAKYLMKETFNRYWASYDWVFRGWVGWSKKVKHIFGHYPSKAILVALAKLDKAKRRVVMDFLAPPSYDEWCDRICFGKQ